MSSTEQASKTNGAIQNKKLIGDQEPPFKHSKSIVATGGGYATPAAAAAVATPAAAAQSKTVSGPELPPIASPTSQPEPSAPAKQQYPPCQGGGGCIKPGRFVCRRCRVARFCSTSCQSRAWPGHQQECVQIWKEDGKKGVPKPYEWIAPSIETSRPFLLSDMQNGPQEDLDPPLEDDEGDLLFNHWRDRPFTLNGKILFTASFYPPEFKAFIQDALRNKTVTWEYLTHDTFMLQASYATIPTNDLMFICEHYMVPWAVKPKLAALTKIFVEHFWRTRGIPGQLFYNPRVAAMLNRHKIELPFTIYGQSIDELRTLTHNMNCKCYHCQARPHRLAKEQETWERVRRREHSKGRYMISWKAKCEFEAIVEDPYALDDLPTLDISNYKQYTHDADEAVNLNNISKIQHEIVNAKLDMLLKERRLPTNKEINEIMAIISGESTTATATGVAVTSSTTYGTTRRLNHSTVGMAFLEMTEERMEEAKAEAIAAKIQAKKQNEPSPQVAQVKKSLSVAAAADDNDSDEVSTSSCGSEIASKKTKKKTKSGKNKKRKKIHVADPLERRNSSPIVAGKANAVPDPAVVAAAVGNADEQQLVSHTGRPMRKSALKAVSYALNNSSSEEEECSHRDQDNTGGRGGGSGGGSDTDEDVNSMSSDWSTEYSSSDVEEDGEENEKGEYSVATSSSRPPGGSKEGSSFAAGARKPTRGLSTGGIRTKTGGSGVSGQRRWSPEEDALLEAGIKEYGIGNWTLIREQYLPHRFRSGELGHRWVNISTAQNTSNVPLNIEEKQLLVKVVEENTSDTSGKVDWRPVAAQLNRTSRYLQKTYNNYKKSLITYAKTSPLTPEEKDIIAERAHAWQGGPGLWPLLAKEFGGRDPQQITNYWFNCGSKK